MFLYYPLDLPQVFHNRSCLGFSTVISRQFTRGWGFNSDGLGLQRFCPPKTQLWQSWFLIFFGYYVEVSHNGGYPQNLQILPFLDVFSICSPLPHLVEAGAQSVFQERLRRHIQLGQGDATDLEAVLASRHHMKHGQGVNLTMGDNYPILICRNWG